MNAISNVSLALYSSFHTGGNAEKLIVCKSIDEIKSVVTSLKNSQISVLGYGTNVLISDRGLTGTTIVTNGGDFSFNDELLIADTGVWWDDIVEESVKQNLWGIELMSGIPSSIGGAVLGNIAAYGQQISDTLEWVEVIATDSQDIYRIPASDLEFNYRFNSLSKKQNLVVLKAAFRLYKTPNKKLEYGSAIRVADELGLDSSKLDGRREIILEVRQRAGSLYDPNTKHQTYTAGSFFKNPIVTSGLAKQIIKFDENGKSEAVLLKQNQVHGGTGYRVSAAHVLLAAGFKRGQTWGQVRLHPDHILKIENIGGAKSQDIYNVAKEIIQTVDTQLGVVLEPEVRFLGDFLR